MVSRGGIGATREKVTFRPYLPELRLVLATRPDKSRNDPVPASQFSARFRSPRVLRLKKLRPSGSRASTSASDKTWGRQTSRKRVGRRSARRKSCKAGNRRMEYI